MESDSDFSEGASGVDTGAAMVGITQYSDDMLAQGLLVSRFYSHCRPDDERRHPYGCPGCDPGAKDRPELALWFELEAKWQARGEPPSCPIQRQQWFNDKNRGASWWVEERDGKAHYDPAC